MDVLPIDARFYFGGLATLIVALAVGVRWSRRSSACLPAAFLIAVVVGLLLIGVVGVALLTSDGSVELS